MRVRVPPPAPSSHWLRADCFGPIAGRTDDRHPAQPGRPPDRGRGIGQCWSGAIGGGRFGLLRMRFWGRNRDSGFKHASDDVCLAKSDACRARVRGYSSSCRSMMAWLAEYDLFSAGYASHIEVKGVCNSGVSLIAPPLRSRNAVTVEHGFPSAQSRTCAARRAIMSPVERAIALNEHPVYCKWHYRALCPGAIAANT